MGNGSTAWPEFSGEALQGRLDGDCQILAGSDYLFGNHNFSLEKHRDYSYNNISNCHLLQCFLLSVRRQQEAFLPELTQSQAKVGIIELTCL